MNSSSVDIRSNKKQPEDRVVRLASLLRIGTWALMGALAVMLILFITWIFIVPTNANGDDFLSTSTVDNLKISFGFNLTSLQTGMTLGSKVWVFLGVTVYALWGFYCISRLHSLFGNFKSKNIFITRNIKLLRSFGYALIVGVFLNWAIFAVTFLAIRIASQSSISDIFDMNISFNSSWVIKLVMIGMAFLAAWIMEIGCELYTDREYTI